MFDVKSGRDLLPAAKLWPRLCFTRVCDSVHGGGDMRARGGMCEVGGMRGRGACMPGRGWGACMAGGRACPGGCSRREVCMAGGHVWWGMWQGRAWHACPPPPTPRDRLVNARPVRILLECILVLMVNLR